MRALRNVCLIGGMRRRSGSNQAGTVIKRFRDALEHAAVAGATPFHLRGGGVGGRPAPVPAPRRARRGERRGARHGRWRDRRGHRDRRERRRRRTGARTARSSRASLRDVAVETLCAAASSGSRMCRAKLKEGGALEALASLAFPPTASGRTKDARGPSSVSVSSLAATRALGAWLADEPWIVEARLMESDVVERRGARRPRWWPDRGRRRGGGGGGGGARRVHGRRGGGRRDRGRARGGGGALAAVVGALAASGVADATLASLEKLVDGGTTHENGVHETARLRLRRGGEPRAGRSPRWASATRRRASGSDRRARRSERTRWRRSAKKRLPVSNACGRRRRRRETRRRG